MDDDDHMAVYIGKEHAARKIDCIGNTIVSLSIQCQYIRQQQQQRRRRHRKKKLVAVITIIIVANAILSIDNVSLVAMCS